MMVQWELNLNIMLQQPDHGGNMFVNVNKLEKALHYLDEKIKELDESIDLKFFMAKNESNSTTSRVDELEKRVKKLEAAIKKLESKK